MSNVARSLSRSISGEIRNSVAYEEQIEGVIDELGSLTASVELKELERSSLARIKNGDLAVDNRAFRTQQFQSVDKLRVSVGEIY